jgi:uncharacterized oxidoreductase
MCELLGGALTGNGATKHDRRFSNGMLAIYIDPKVVDPAHFFDGEVARYISFFKDSKLAQGHDAVLIPGEPEAATRADRVKNGAVDRGNMEFHRGNGAVGGDRRRSRCQGNRIG